MGGVCDSFDLGESLLQVSTSLVCRENKDALPVAMRDMPLAKVSVFDLLDEVTHTRQATEAGVGQMIYNFEALCPGAQVYTRLALKPYANSLAIGALAAALETYMANNPVVAGQSARGYGMVSPAWIERPEGFEQARDEYEAYLEANQAELAGWISDGSLGTGARVVS